MPRKLKGFLTKQKLPEVSFSVVGHVKDGKAAYKVRLPEIDDEWSATRDFEEFKTFDHLWKQTHGMVCHMCKSNKAGSSKQVLCQLIKAELKGTAPKKAKAALTRTKNWRLTRTNDKQKKADKRAEQIATYLQSVGNSITVRPILEMFLNVDLDGIKSRKSPKKQESLQRIATLPARHYSLPLAPLPYAHMSAFAGHRRVPEDLPSLERKKSGIDSAVDEEDLPVLELKLESEDSTSSIDIVDSDATSTMSTKSLLRDFPEEDTRTATMSERPKTMPGRHHTRSHMRPKIKPPNSPVGLPPPPPRKLSPGTNPIQGRHRKAKSLDLRDTIQQLPGSGNIFGRTLEEVMELQKGIPDKLPIILTVLTKTIKQIGGFHEEGIFRKCGLNTEVLRLKTLFRLGAYDLSHEIRIDPVRRTVNAHVLCDILKEWLRDLKEGVIPERLCHKCLEVGRTNDANQLEDLMREIPELHSNVIYHVIRFLRDSLQYSDETKMDVTNLATIFGPSFIQLPVENATQLLKLHSQQTRFVELLITQLQLPEEYDPAMDDVPILDRLVFQSPRPAISGDFGIKPLLLNPDQGEGQLNGDMYVYNSQHSSDHYDHYDHYDQSDATGMQVGHRDEPELAMVTVGEEAQEQETISRSDSTPVSCTAKIKHVDTISRRISQDPPRHRRAKTWAIENNARLSELQASPTSDFVLAGEKNTHFFPGDPSRGLKSPPHQPLATPEQPMSLPHQDTPLNRSLSPPPPYIPRSPPPQRQRAYSTSVLEGHRSPPRFHCSSPLSDGYKSPPYRAAPLHQTPEPPSTLNSGAKQRQHFPNSQQTVQSPKDVFDKLHEVQTELDEARNERSLLTSRLSLLESQVTFLTSRRRKKVHNRSVSATGSISRHLSS